MSEIGITYDYKTIKVKREIETLITDTYVNLGWEVTNTCSTEGSIFYINISFKRNRKLENKADLLKLQAKADTIIANIENLQNKKKSAGIIPALSTGIIGTLVFGGGMSMCTVLSGVGFMLGGIALGIVGASVALLAYPLFKKVNKKQTSKIEPMLETELDNLAGICEEASGLLK